MSRTRPEPPLRLPSGRAARGALAGLLIASLTACGGVEAPFLSGAPTPAGDQQPTVSPTAAPASRAVVLVSPGDPTLPWRPDEPITVRAIDGRLTEVEVVDGQGQPLPGRLSADGASWSSSGDLLGFGARYQVQARAVDGQGLSTQITASVRVATPERVGASMNLSDGAVVGIGMPMVVRLTAPVEDRAALERRLKVRTTPAVDGAWSWTGAQELQYRPQKYWAPGTEITVSADLEGVRLGDQQWGQDRMERTVRIGSANIYRVDVAAHTMQVLVGGVVRGTIPITTGKPGFLTRNGVKVIMSKERSRRMRSETVGIAENSREGYDLTVDYAMRLTNSGEFIHAAPWSVRQQGRANVSHGCTGMSTANAKWLYDLSKPGDVVEYVNSPRPMTATNGYGAWNVPWERWKAATALGQA